MKPKVISEIIKVYQDIVENEAKGGKVIVLYGDIDKLDPVILNKCTLIKLEPETNETAWRRPMEPSNLW